MQCQRNFLLPGRRFDREVCCRQGAKGIAEIEDVKFHTLIRPGTFRVRIVCILGRCADKGIVFAFERNIDRSDGIKVRRKNLLMAQRVIGNIRQRTLNTTFT